MELLSIKKLEKLNLKVFPQLIWHEDTKFMAYCAYCGGFVDLIASLIYLFNTY